MLYTNDGKVPVFGLLAGVPLVIDAGGLSSGGPAFRSPPSRAVHKIGAASVLKDSFDEISGWRCRQTQM